MSRQADNAAVQTAERNDVRVQLRRSRFFLWASIALGIAVLWGFGPTYFLRSFITTRDITPFIHVHALLFISWVMLMIVQAVLVAAHRTRIHRQIGKLGTLLAAAVVLIGVLVPILATPARVQAWEALPDPVARFAFVAGNASGPILFGLFVTAGFLWRRRAETHKRLMLLASIAIINAAVARILDDFGWPIVLGPFGFMAPTGPFMRMSSVSSAGFGNVFVLPFVAALALHDSRRLGRPHLTTIVGGVVLLLFEPVLLFVAAQLRA
jgi:hypothetical protein